MIAPENKRKRDYSFQFIATNSQRIHILNLKRIHVCTFDTFKRTFNFDLIHIKCKIQLKCSSSTSHENAIQTKIYSEKKNTIEIQMDEKDSFEQIKMETVLAFVFILLEFSSAQR